jgi:hypothetical protein
MTELAQWLCRSSIGYKGSSNENKGHEGKIQSIIFPNFVSFVSPW